MIRLKINSNEIVQDLCRRLEDGSIPVDSVGSYNLFVKMVRINYGALLTHKENRVVVDAAYEILKQHKKN